MIFVLKLRFLRKDEYEQMSFLKKTTFLEWGTEYDEWYIIPNITISFNGGVGINFHWFKICYSHFWKVVTIGEEDEYAEFIRNKNKNK
jgi:hypothetical protein